jgi:hypothetical protein
MRRERGAHRLVEKLDARAFIAEQWTPVVR